MLGGYCEDVKPLYFCIPFSGEKERRYEGKSSLKVAGIEGLRRWGKKIFLKFFLLK